MDQCLLLQCLTETGLQYLCDVYLNYSCPLNEIPDQCLTSASYYVLSGLMEEKFYAIKAV